MATDRAKLVTIVQIIVAITLLLSKVVLVFMKAPLYTFVIVVAVDLVLGGMLMTFYFAIKLYLIFIT